jgi:hypothetical protein
MVILQTTPVPDPLPHLQVKQHLASAFSSTQVQKLWKAATNSFTSIGLVVSIMMCKWLLYIGLQLMADYYNFEYYM